MTGEDLVSCLNARLPQELARDLVAQFLAIRTDTLTGTLERASPGKFVETLVQVLQHLSGQPFEKEPKVDHYLKQLESTSTTLPDDLKLAVARVARGMYTLRNKRNIAHKSAIDPNMYDLRYLYVSAQWSLSELIRWVTNSDMATAGQLVEFVQLPASAVVEDFGDRRLVLRNVTAIQEFLLLLRHYYPATVPAWQIRKDMDRVTSRTVSRVIVTAYAERFIQGDETGGYKLTALGFQTAGEVFATSAKQNAV